MKKILILTTATGGGHNQVCHTLTEELEQHNLQVNRLDFISDISRFLHFLIVKGYDFLYKRVPRLYGVLYKISDNQFMNYVSTAICYRFLKKGIVQYYNNYKPDIIVSVHPLATGIISRLKEKEVIKVPAVMVITDFIPHASHIAKNIDIYITGSKHTKELLVKRGVPASKIQPLGIPIKRDFLEYSMQEKKGDSLNVLIMGGADGAKYINRVVKYILFLNKKSKLVITVICGNNKKLKRKLDKLYGEKHDSINIVGFTPYIKKYMNESDIIISKPGAITSTEAYSQKVPIIIPYSIPGHERANGNYLEKSGVAKKVNNMVKLGLIISRLANNQDYLKDFKSKMPQDTVNYKTDEIVEKIIGISG
jgi:processive 1,2-diacylglycerol beta-glucosyltransferase